MTRLCFRMRRIAAMVAVLLAAEPALAQKSPTAVQTGGQQERIRTTAGVQPMQRINSRIQNRIQSRVRNRIDPNYAPQADAASSFEAAEDQVTRSGPPHVRSRDPD
jgi:hypothetical protein